MEHFYSTRDLSVEEGFAICTGFFSALFSQIEPEVKLLKKGEVDTITCYCCSICNGKRAFAEWNESVFQITGITKSEQKCAILTPDQIFQSMTAFCNYYNNLFDLELEYLVSLLQAMKLDPKKFKIQTDLLKNIINKSKARVLAISFNWKAEITDKLSVEQAYWMCTVFFLDLWPAIISKLPPPGNSIYDAHDIFCMNICLEGTTFSEWNEAVYRATKIPKEEQKKTFLKLDQCVSCILEFCKYFNEKHEKKLDFLVNLITKMIENSQGNKQEWDLLKKIQIGVSSGCIQGQFNWNDYLLV